MNVIDRTTQTFSRLRLSIKASSGMFCLRARLPSIAGPHARYTVTTKQKYGGRSHVLSVSWPRLMFIRRASSFYLQLGYRAVRQISPRLGAAISPRKPQDSLPSSRCWRCRPKRPPRRLAGTSVLKGSTTASHAFRPEVLILFARQRRHWCAAPAGWSFRHPLSRELT